MGNMIMTMKMMIMTKIMKIMIMIMIIKMMMMIMTMIMRTTTLTCAFITVKPSCWNKLSRHRRSAAEPCLWESESLLSSSL